MGKSYFYATNNLGQHGAAATEVLEGGVLGFQIKRYGDTSRRERVRVYAQSGTAKANEDFKSKYEYLYFNPGETVKTFNVQSINDYNPEATETFTVQVSDPRYRSTYNGYYYSSRNVTEVLDGSVTGIIKDNDLISYQPQVQYVPGSLPNNQPNNQTNQTQQTNVTNTYNNTNNTTTINVTGDGNSFSNLGNTSTAFDKVGTKGNDVFNGSNGNNQIDGGDGDDRIVGLSGKDRLMGGNGNDFLHGNHGKDVIIGGAGNDTLRGGHGHDVISGEGGADWIWGGIGKNTVSAGANDNAQDQIYVPVDDKQNVNRNPGSRNADILMNVGREDKIFMHGIEDWRLAFGQTTHDGKTGMGIYTQAGNLEALVVGNWTTSEVNAMTQGGFFA